jgi:hypothetical protein
MRAFLLCFLLITSTPVIAEPLTQEEQALLNDTRDRFIEGLIVFDVDVMMSIVPPRIVDFLAEANGVTPAELKESLRQELTQSRDEISFSNMRLETEGLDATRSEDGGEAYVWGFARSAVEMTVSGTKFRAEGHTLALLEGGAWYLVRLAEAGEIEMMRALYPFFAKVEFPESTMMQVE